jgi:hypothetical protein
MRQTSVEGEIFFQPKKEIVGEGEGKHVRDQRINLCFISLSFQVMRKLQGIPLELLQMFAWTGWH